MNIQALLAAAKAANALPTPAAPPPDSLVRLGLGGVPSPGQLAQSGVDLAGMLAKISPPPRVPPEAGPLAALGGGHKNLLATGQAGDAPPIKTPNLAEMLNSLAVPGMRADGASSAVDANSVPPALSTRPRTAYEAVNELYDQADKIRNRAYGMAGPNAPQYRPPKLNPWVTGLMALAGFFANRENPRLQMGTAAVQQFIGGLNQRAQQQYQNDVQRFQVDNHNLTDHQHAMLQQAATLEQRGNRLLEQDKTEKGKYLDLARTLLGDAYRIKSGQVSEYFTRLRDAFTKAGSPDMAPTEQDEEDLRQHLQLAENRDIAAKLVPQAWSTVRTGGPAARALAGAFLVGVGQKFPELMEVNGIDLKTLMDSLPKPTPKEILGQKQGVNLDARTANTEARTDQTKQMTPVKVREGSLKADVSAIRKQFLPETLQKQLDDFDSKKAYRDGMLQRAEERIGVARDRVHTAPRRDAAAERFSYQQIAQSQKDLGDAIDEQRKEEAEFRMLRTRLADVQAGRFKLPIGTDPNEVVGQINVAMQNNQADRTGRQMKIDRLTKSIKQLRDEMANSRGGVRPAGLSGQLPAVYPDGGVPPVSIEGLPPGGPPPKGAIHGKSQKGRSYKFIPGGR